MRKFRIRVHRDNCCAASLDTMGRGGDATVPGNGLIRRLRSRSDLLRVPSLQSLKGVRQDLTVLKYIWFHKASGSDHAERLESFYGPQAHACAHSYPCSVDRMHVPASALLLVWS